MSRLIKANTYIPVSAEAFEMPFPIKLELFYRNTLLCVYSINEDRTVDYTYNANTEIPIAIFSSVPIIFKPPTAITFSLSSII